VTTRFTHVRRLLLLAAGLWLLGTSAGCVMDPGGATCEGFPPTKHHYKAQRVIPCGPSQGYCPTCWHTSQECWMAGRAWDLETDPIPGTTASAGPKLQTYQAPPGPPEQEIIPLPPSVANGSRERGKTSSDAAELFPAPDRAKTGVRGSSPFEGERRLDGQSRTQPGLETPEKALPNGEGQPPPAPPAAKPQARARTPSCPELNLTLNTDREAEGSPGSCRPWVFLPQLYPRESQSPVTQETSPAVKPRPTMLPTSCLAEGRETIASIPAAIDDRGLPPAGQTIPQSLFTHGCPQ
jgi:hypothetical protein